MRPEINLTDGRVYMGGVEIQGVTNVQVNGWVPPSRRRLAQVHAELERQYRWLADSQETVDRIYNSSDADRTTKAQAERMLEDGGSHLAWLKAVLP